MRTEDDLRAALTALERHAPAAARVLPGGERRPSRGLRSPRAVRRLAVTAAAAALAGAVTALALPAVLTGSTQQGAVTAPPSPANDAALRARLLAAFSAAGDKIAHVSSTSLNTGASPIVVESWAYPSRPSPGQLVRTRTLTYNLSGTLRYDDEASFVMTAAEASQIRPPMTKGQRIIIDYVGKTFSDQQDTLLPETGDPSSSALIAYDIKTAHWSVRNVTLNGRAALELSWKEASRGNPSTVHLWVDAGTYLPLRETDTFGPAGMVNNTTVSYEYLPATSANLAKLAPPVPAGFRQVSNSLNGGHSEKVLPPSASPSPRAG